MIKLDYKPQHKNKYQVDLTKYPPYEKVSKAPTDDEIKLSLYNNIYGHNLNETTREQLKFFGYNKEGSKSLDDSIKIKIFDKFQTPIIPDEDEFIHRKDWAPLESLLGCTHEILHHPIFKIANEYIINNYIQNTDTLIVLSCSKSKPYSLNNLFGSYKLISDTVVMSNSGIIPINEGNDFSFCYPFRYYNWNHMDEFKTKGLLQAEEDFMYWSLYNLLKVTEYKKIAFVAYPANYYPNYLNVMNRLEKNFSEIKFHYSPSDDEYNEIFRTYARNNGLAMQRLKLSNIVKNSVRKFFDMPVITPSKSKWKHNKKSNPIKKFGLEHIED